MRDENYLIIAHFHSKGLLRSDFLNLLKQQRNNFSKIYLVSTKLRKKEINKIPKNIYVKIKKNEGYDFLSWKKGIDRFLKENKKELDKKYIFLLNSSYYFYDNKKLFQKIFQFKGKNKNKVWSLSKSYEMSEHLQSGFYCFPAKFLSIPSFYSWWKNVKSFKNRQVIVMKYELGFSNFLIRNNFEIDCIFKENIALKPNTFFKKFSQKFRDVFWKEPKLYKKNPTHYFWRSYLKNFGVIKIELIKKNTINTDLSYLKILDKKTNYKLLKESFNN